MLIGRNVIQAKSFAKNGRFKVFYLDKGESYYVFVFFCRFLSFYRITNAKKGNCLLYKIK